MIYFEKGSDATILRHQELKEGLFEALDRIGPRRKILAIPPDFTRYHSKAGELTAFACEYYRSKLTHILPALGTHSPMSSGEINRMFPGIPKKLFHVHDWRNDIRSLGIVPSSFIKQVSGGTVNYEWTAQVNRLLVEGDFDLILSIGQVVPHEVTGMANYNKNIFIGTGGAEAINKSHFLGAVYGMEKMMGKTDTPVRQVLDYTSDHLSDRLPLIVYVLTVIGRDIDGKQVVRGLFIGDDKKCFILASELSQRVNIELLDAPIKKTVVYLDPSEYKSTWLGNKAIYRTRMAIADGGELVILAPGLKTFGEDLEIDRLIRKFGYRGTPATLDAVNSHPELAQNLSAAAHLIHGSSEGRFQITYCPGKLTEKEILSVHFNYGNLKKMIKRYDPGTMKNGINRLPDGEEVFFISNPALGLWAVRSNSMNSII